MRCLTFMTLTITSTLGAAVLLSCSRDSPAAEQTAASEGQEQAQAPPQAAPSQGPEQAPQNAPAAAPGSMQQLRASCPMLVDGAEVAVSEMEGGMALTFTTDAGDVGDLRARVRQMAEMYGQHGGRGGMMWHHMRGQGPGRGGPGRGMGRQGMGGHPMAGRGPMPASTATVTEVEKGAKLELRPTDASQLDALREHIRWHQERMETGECWMLQEQRAAEGADTQGTQQ